MWRATRPTFSTITQRKRRAHPARLRSRPVVADRAPTIRIRSTWARTTRRQRMRSAVDDRTTTAATAAAAADQVSATISYRRPRKQRRKAQPLTMMRKRLAEVDKLFLPHHPPE